MPTKTPIMDAEPRSKRGRALHELSNLRPIDLIPIPPGGNAIEAVGAYAYYIRPDGATIKDALICYPNGGIPDISDPRMRDRYGANALQYQNRMIAKGFEYIGPSLTEAGMKRLVEVMESNREDERLFCEDEIASAKEIASNSDLPEVRAQQKRRVRQLTARLEQMSTPIDIDDLLAELTDIARAQQLAKIDPNILRVMKNMIGEVNEKMAGYMTHFTSGDGAALDQGMKRSSGSGSAEDFDK